MPEQVTIGGMLATGMTGPHRQGYGGLRDYCIGVRFVTGDGRKAKGGGRVVKNVAGYDMMKLLIGSQGTLGIITSASFKLFPAPRQTRTFVSEFAGIAEAIEFRNHVLRSPLDPICLEVVSPQARGVLPDIRFRRAVAHIACGPREAMLCCCDIALNWAPRCRAKSKDRANRKSGRRWPTSRT